MRMRAKHLMRALFENKMQAFTVCFEERNEGEDASKALMRYLKIRCRHLQLVFEERNDTSKALHASTIDLKMQALWSFFFGRNEVASKALNASSLNHKMPELCSLFLRKVRMWAKHLMHLPNI